MERGATGDWVTPSTVGGEAVRAFVPKPLPPVPALLVDDALRGALDRALLAVGRLDGVSMLLPDTHLFLYNYVRKEALLSSQIEGTKSSFSDLLLFELDEAPGVPIDDVVEVSSYVAALDHGLARLREGFPLSNRLLREMHGILLRQGRGASQQPGEFRSSQNWIGGTRPGNAAFVPPPPERVAEGMGELERFLHADAGGALVKAALAHVQLETIHPFLDGNGRLGRLLITVLLCHEGLLRKPLLYLSLYLKTHRAQYYALLDQVRVSGDWETWVAFFADGVRETADGAAATAERLTELFKADTERIQSLPRPSSALHVHRALQQRPIHSIARLASETGLSLPTVTKALQDLAGESIGIVREVTGKRRNRLFAYSSYLDILSQGTEPLAS
ncbi:MAG: Fic family protein [bacterium]